MPTYAAPRRIIQILSLAIFVLRCAVPCRAEPITEFTTIKELKARSSQLENLNTDDKKWFDANSNYGRIFMDTRGPQLMLTWLGLLSADFQLADSNSRVTRPVAIANAIYKSNRSEAPPINMQILVPHPRSMSSRKLNLISEFSELQNTITRSEHHEGITIAGFPAQLAIDPEKEECRLLIELPRLSIMYLQVAKCEDGKKLVSFCDAIDIFHLAEKLEK